MIGSHMTRYFLNKYPEAEFVLPAGWKHKGEPDNMAWAIEGNEDRCHVVTCDLSTPLTPKTKARFGKVDMILNLASDSHVDRSIENPVDFVQNNVNLVLTMLEYAREVKPKVFLQFSTDEVFGVAPFGTNHDEWASIVPSNPYSASKAAQEAIAISYWRTYSVPLIITNTMNVISERQDWEKFVPLCVKKITNGETLDIHSYPGETQAGSRYYIYADSVAEAVDFVTQQPLQMYPEFQRPTRFNIVGDEELDNLELAQFIGKILGKEVLYRFTDAHSSRPGHDTRYALDGKKLAEAGWQPSANLRENLTHVVHELSRMLS